MQAINLYLQSCIVFSFLGTFGSLPQSIAFKHRRHHFIIVVIVLIDTNFVAVVLVIQRSLIIIRRLVIVERRVGVRQSQRHGRRQLVLFVAIDQL